MSGVGVIIKKDVAKKLLDEGWKSFRKVSERGASITWCNERACVNMYRNGSELCANKSYPSYPYRPTFEECGDPESALTYALLLMETYNSPPTGKSLADEEKEALKRLIEAGAVGVSTVGENYPYYLASDFEKVLASEGFPELSDEDRYELKKYLERRLPYKTLWEKR